MADRTAFSQVPSMAESTTTDAARAHRVIAGRKRRSCLICSRRKVKCDKQKPCTSCVKSGTECVFPINTTNRAKTETTPGLAEMLQRLEKAVQTLGPKRSENSEAVPPPARDPLAHAGSPQTYVPTPSATTAALEDETAENGAGAPDGLGTATFETTTQGIASRGEALSVSSSHGESPGMIVRDHGRDTYVRRWFWDDGINKMDSGSFSDTESDTEHENQLPSQSSTTSQYSGLTGTSGDKVIQILADQKMNLWSIYKERVEPLTKLLHLPSLEKAVVGSHPLDAGGGMQCIILAVYYGAVTSLSEEECILIFGDGQAQVLSHMRVEMEGLFAKALLLHTGDIRPLQALTLYLVSLRHHEPRLSWKLSGLAIRLAQNFGLHREDSFVGLTKFETEMRRRLWWQLANMDAPSAEDYSGEYNLLEMSSFDTHPPQNLNDSQLDPAMTEYPPEADGITEMTFTLASCQITNMYRCIADSRRVCGNTGKGYAELTLQERAVWIGDCESNFTQRFFREYSPTSPFHWSRPQVTVILTKMLFHKIRLHGCNPLQDAEAMSEETRDRLFLVAIEVIELNYKLRTDPRTRPWLWLFGSYTQWHAFSLVLVWLRMRPRRRNSTRAWEAVEKAIVLRWEHPTSLLNGRKPLQWRSIIRLLEKARSARRESSKIRARRGSRKQNHMGQASTGGPFGSASTTRSTMANQKPLAGAIDLSNISSGQSPMRKQLYAQQQSANVASERGDIVPPTAPAAPSAISTSWGLVNETTPNTWGLSSQSMMPDGLNVDITGEMSDPDFMMGDGQFSVEDFQGLEDLAFLDDLIY